MASQKSPPRPKFTYNLFSILFSASILTTTTASSSSPSFPASGSSYQISCTMCSACHNPCGTQSPPPPTGGSSYPYYSPPPPPPTQPTYKYYPPPPPPPAFYRPPGSYGSYAGPPPPNPIVPYFPFYYHTPPPYAPATTMSPCGSLSPPGWCALLLCAVVLLFLCSWNHGI